MSEIKPNSIAQVVSGKEIAFIGCCIQVREVFPSSIIGDIAYPLNPNCPSELIEVQLPISDVKYIGESHIKPQ